MATAYDDLGNPLPCSRQLPIAAVAGTTGMPIDQLSASCASNDDPVQFLRSSPNPFSLSTHIAYRIDSPTDVRLTVSDALGRTVRTLVDGFQTPGTHSVLFDAAALPRGMYLCRIDTRKGTRVMRMLLQR